MTQKELLLLKLGWTEDMISQFILDDGEENSLEIEQNNQIIEGTVLSLNYDSINASTLASYIIGNKRK